VFVAASVNGTGFPLSEWVRSIAVQLDAILIKSSRSVFDR